MIPFYLTLPNTYLEEISRGCLDIVRNGQPILTDQLSRVTKEYATNFEQSLDPERRTVLAALPSVGDLTTDVANARAAIEEMLAASQVAPKDRRRKRMRNVDIQPSERYLYR
jgi:hypothetical protein